MGTVFIYGLQDPRDGKIKYIGKSVNLRARFNAHLEEAKHKINTDKCIWIRALLSCGLKPTLIIIEEVDAAFWRERERAWIVSLRESHTLKNTMKNGANFDMNAKWVLRPHLDAIKAIVGAL